MLLISENGQFCEVGKAFGLGGVSLLRGAGDSWLLPPSIKDDKAVALGVVGASPNRLAPFIHERNKQC